MGLHLSVVLNRASEWMAAFEKRQKQRNVEVTDLRCAIHRRNGTVSIVDISVPLEPSAWSDDNAKEALWACVRVLDVHGVDRVRLVEVERALSWQLEVVTATGTLTTPALRLSSMAAVWLSGAAFELPSEKHTH